MIRAKGLPSNKNNTEKAAADANHRGAYTAVASRTEEGKGHTDKLDDNDDDDDNDAIDSLVRVVGGGDRIRNSSDNIRDDGIDEEEDLASFVTANANPIPMPSSSYFSNTFHTTTSSTLLPDEGWQWRGIVLAEGPFVVKFVKFTVWTFVGIATMFHVVRWLKFENDETLTLSDVWRFEGNLIVTDALVFFVVGRLHRQKGVDHLAWMAWCLAANFYSSYITSFALFRHSFTPYEMHCLWPWQLWAFLLVLIPIIVTVAVWHVQHAWQERILVQICLEMIFCLTFLLAPLVASPYFHFHHWFAGFLVGMHFNFDVWWSRAAMAWCWGQYINGIAVYGRDPVLTCEYAYFMSVTQRCPFVHCYLEALDNPDHTFDNITVAPMIPPDWRNCSADSFHP